MSREPQCLEGVTYTTAFLERICISKGSGFKKIVFCDFEDGVLGIHDRGHITMHNFVPRMECGHNAAMSRASALRPDDHLLFVLGWNCLCRGLPMLRRRLMSSHGLLQGLETLTIWSSAEAVFSLHL